MADKGNEDHEKIRRIYKPKTDKNINPKPIREEYIVPKPKAEEFTIPNLNIISDLRKVGPGPWKKLAEILDPEKELEKETLKLREKVADLDEKLEAERERHKIAEPSLREAVRIAKEETLAEVKKRKEHTWFYSFVIVASAIFGAGVVYLLASLSS